MPTRFWIVCNFAMYGATDPIIHYFFNILQKLEWGEKSNSVLLSYNKPRKGVFKEYHDAEILERTVQKLMVSYLGFFYV